MERINLNRSPNFHSTCRTCMESLSDLQHDIFKTPDLKTKLIVCTSLPVEPGDAFPTRICQSCFSKLSDFYSFQQMCVSSMQRCQALLAKENDQLIVELSIEQDELTDHILMFEELKEEPEEDPFYGKSQEFTDMGSATTEKEEAASSEEESDNSVDQEDEDDSSESDASGGISENPEDEPTKHSFMCELCNRKFETGAMLGAHKLTHKGQKIFPCPHCARSFTRPCRLRMHISIIHERKERERLPCPEKGCDRTYAVRQTLAKHLKEAHSGADKPKSQQAYVCEDCGKVLSSMFTLRNHRYMHTGQELPYACTECGKRHMTKHKLKDHMNRHNGIRNYVCPHCGARKTTRTELNTHINYHTKEKRYPCKYCEQVFNSVGNMGRHVRIVHKGIKDYECKYCEKAFGKAETRNHHEMTHTGEKPHECSICHKTFIQVVALRKHMKRHYKAKEIISEALARGQEASSASKES